MTDGQNREVGVQRVTALGARALLTAAVLANANYTITGMACDVQEILAYARMARLCPSISARTMAQRIVLLVTPTITSPIKVAWRILAGARTVTLSRPVLRMEMNRVHRAFQGTLFRLAGVRRIIVYARMEHLFISVPQAMEPNVQSVTLALD